MTMQGAEDAYVEAPDESQPSAEGTQSSVLPLTREELQAELRAFAQAQYRDVQGLFTPVQQRLAAIEGFKDSLTDVLGTSRQTLARVDRLFDTTDPEGAAKARQEIAAELKAQGAEAEAAALKRQVAELSKPAEQPDQQIVQATARWNAEAAAMKRYAKASNVPWTPQLEQRIWNMGVSSYDDAGWEELSDKAEKIIDALAEEGTPKPRAPRVPASRTLGTVATPPTDIWAAYGRGEIAWGPQVIAAGKALGAL